MCEFLGVPKPLHVGGNICERKNVASLFCVKDIIFFMVGRMRANYWCFTKDASYNRLRGEHEEAEMHGSPALQ